MSRVLILNMDVMAGLATLADESIDACVTDPPYGLGFMGKEWDTFKPGSVKQAERLVKREPIVSDNPNLNGRRRSPAISPSQIEYDESLTGHRGFQVWTEKWARGVLRVLKPGGHLLCSGSPRSYHRMACGIEDAGFEVRDAVLWLFSQGFPKSHNFGCKCGIKSTAKHVVRRVPETDLSEAISTPTAENEVLQHGVSQQDLQGARKPEHSEVGPGQPGMEGRGDVQAEQGELYRPEVCAVPAGVRGDGAEGRLRDGASVGGGEAPRALLGEDGGSPSRGPQYKEQRRRESGAVRKQRRAQETGVGGKTCARCGGLIDWAGWGTALKPAWEPIVVARKALTGTVSDNVERFGTGALNIDGCRVEGAAGAGVWGSSNKACQDGRTFNASPDGEGFRSERHRAGRWPANVIHDGSECVVAGFPDEAGAAAPVHKRNGDKFRNTFGSFAGDVDEKGSTFHGDSGSAARFFYVPKADRADRDDGMSGFDKKPLHWSSGDQSPGTFQSTNTDRTARNNHPTVKPTDLMRYLCALVTPPGGLVLDPFMGSGSTGRGALLVDFQFIGIEREAEYVEIACSRIREISPLFVDIEVRKEVEHGKETEKAQADTGARAGAVLT